MLINLLNIIQLSLINVQVQQEKLLHLIIYD